MTLYIQQLKSWEQFLLRNGYQCLFFGMSLNVIPAAQIFMIFVCLPYFLTSNYLYTPHPTKVNKIRALAFGAIFSDFMLIPKPKLSPPLELGRERRRCPFLCFCYVRTFGWHWAFQQFRLFPPLFPRLFTSVSYNAPPCTPRNDSKSFFKIQGQEAPWWGKVSVHLF